MSRLLLVANRLPVTVAPGGAQGPLVRRSTGGVATGLRSLHERSGGLWIGWPGRADVEPPARAALERRLAELRTVPVWLDPGEARRFYEGFANGVLWPLFHYLLDPMPLHVQGWDAYERVNARFADAVAAHHRPGDLVWVHDYQLMLVPRLVRERLPQARIGYFLHVPFPASEVFRILPARDRLLEGVLGADLIGFHTAAYMRHFASSLLRVLGLATDVDRVEIEGRTVRLGVFPMGIDPARFAALAEDARVAAEVRALRAPGDAALLVGIDRLDYTKGIPRRLLAFEVLLRDHPNLRGRVRLVQVAVPSRTNVGAYQDFRRQVDEMVGRLNGAFGTPRWVPVHYVYRGISERELVALYRAADVMLVTPVRDGMNLVAKEFVAARTDGDGVLVLSEFAGAAAELAEAVLVNPYDVDATADALRRALGLSEDERRARVQALRKRVVRYDVHHWARSFLEALEDASAHRATSTPAATAAGHVARLVGRMRAAERLVLLLDYDGTLVPFAGVPDLATPDEALLSLLRALAARPRTEVHVVSGRSRETMERWLGALPVGLHAEHGFWSRRPGGLWTAPPVPTMEWRERVLAILEHFAARTPGSLVEEKTVSLAWHYRMTEPEFGTRQANELRLHLTELLSNAPVEILPGEKVVEVRPHGMHKGAIVAPILAQASPGTLAVAVGDDRTDEDLFAALPPGALAIHVGPAASRASVRLGGVAEVRRLLRAVVGDA
ncbi:MAG TPA: bifunctional alpha,alpha-trehalose-phosphate synthase (UDP-forming)/trehalose-phosphatase [Candidatus Binatia bacterium]|nr:bifunctional alpha,alpha-trehalose-phosphate synthase (UDP-forming)/trehalose-phosphatase [Candidatus Binatia bacterium]